MKSYTKNENNSDETKWFVRNEGISFSIIPSFFDVTRWSVMKSAFQRKARDMKSNN